MDAFDAQIARTAVATSIVRIAGIVECVLTTLIMSIAVAASMYGD